MKALLVCNGGISTSQIAAKMTELGAANGDKFDAMSIISAEWMDVINEYDLIMVSPQTRFRFNAVQDFVKENGKGQKLFQMRPENYRVDKSDEIYKEVLDFVKA